VPRDVHVHNVPVRLLVPVCLDALSVSGTCPEERPENFGAGSKEA
jgi:hypothetical protein